MDLKSLILPTIIPRGASIPAIPVSELPSRREFCYIMAINFDEIIGNDDFGIFKLSAYSTLLALRIISDVVELTPSHSRAFEKNVRFDFRSLNEIVPCELDCKNIKISSAQLLGFRQPIPWQGD